jgi:hypothetical protein
MKASTDYMIQSRADSKLVSCLALCASKASIGFHLAALGF